MTMSKKAAVVGLAILMAACSNNPLLRTSQATSRDAARAIDDALAEAEKPSANPGRSSTDRLQVPSAVTDALLPSLADSQGSEGRFDISARELDARAFFAGLVADSHYNVVVHPDVNQAITLNLRDVSVPEVMTIASDLYDLDVQRNGQLYRILPGGVRTRLFPIDYLHFKRQGGSETRVSSGQVSNARNSGSQGRSDSGGQSDSGSSLVGTRISTATESDFWADLDSTVRMILAGGENNQVITNPGAGLVMVRATPTELQLVEQYLTKTELIMQRQVVLEAKILEISLNAGYQQGINWSDIQNASGITASDGLPTEFTAQSLLGRAVTSGDIGGVFSASFREGSFTGMIELLGRQGNVQILSSPRISTVNNQKAVIKVGTDEFFVTDIDFNEDNNAAGISDNTSTSVELTPFFSGISLDVTPQIAEDGSVTLHVHPSVSEVEDQQKIITIGERDVTLPLALSTVRETDSVIRANSGQIVVIGGLIQDKSEDRNSAVPFFSEIPILGEAFKQRNFDSEKSELVILLRPIVADAKGVQADISASRERMTVLRELLQSSESVTPEPEKAKR
ncbi:pilus (MSHA type) biogenesis protein MshL [Marinobacter caseinilyticus]|uniref:pilus (MSHA type) biogenesis protein MshL n=1 Tax=Marinobacter caseinilyticus TaxID=2692195 RepID=UPI001407408C|nr:pilus (MSHA type) biogenesis protein MshL [Marinobacter caseinilyticus]